MITEADIRNGTTFILHHFNQPWFPRRIFTPIEKQVTVYSVDEIIERFKASRFVDSRISAYPYYGEKHFDYLGIEKPDLLFTDIDREHFKSESALKANLNKTLKNFKVKLCCADVEPTILESGSGGFHIILPLLVPNLKQITFFMKWTKEPNRDFLRFLEPFLCSKSDPNHYGNVSLNNCLLRVPGSINSKNGNQVKVVETWNGIRPDLKFVYGNFLGYLVDKKNEAIERTRINSNSRSKRGYVYNSWINYCRDKGRSEEVI